MSQIIYVLEMLRWGKPEEHHYILGGYSKLKTALEKGIENEKYRGGCGKYQPRIVELKLDDHKQRTVVHDLEQAKRILGEMNEKTE